MRSRLILGFTRTHAYVRANGRVPFDDTMSELDDEAKSSVLAVIRACETADRVRLGFLFKAVGSLGVREARWSNLRIYGWMDGASRIVLSHVSPKGGGVRGGKKRQDADIAKAGDRKADYQERIEEEGDDGSQGQ